jgi:predicted nucleic acid-binding protein
MTLVDTSVWIDHLRHGEPKLVDLLAASAVVVHPFVLGELAMGGLRQRSRVLGALGQLPKTAVARDHEVMQLVERHQLFGRGLGYIDAHLLAAVLLTPGACIWSRDKTLQAAAAAMTLADPRLD